MRLTFQASSPPVVIAVIAILGILAVIAWLILQITVAVSEGVIKPLAPSLNVLLIAGGIVLAVGGVAIAYSFMSSPEGRAELRSATRAAGRLASSGIRRGAGVASRAASRGAGTLRALRKQK